ncbi:MAG: ABC transporter ATP-binding protein [Desulfotignum sp.]|nr:ABC transporter ATP-binding protein [Desulfotignum sp.]
MHGRVDITGLAFGYTASEQIFSGIDIHLAPGQVFCLLGPNGSGKSTLLKCIMQLLSPVAGRVELDGLDLDRLSANRIAGKLGFVPQSLVSAIPFTVAEIVVMGRASQIRMTASPSKKDRDMAMAALERMGIAHLAEDGITILMASHFPDHAFLTSHQVGILKNGRLLALGNPDDTLSESLLYDTYGIHIRVVEVKKDIHRKICVPVLQESSPRTPVKEVS